MAIDFKSAANNSFQSLASGVSSGIGSSIGGAIGGLMTKWLNPSAYKAAMREHLTGAEREQNAFNAQQAAIARQFDLDMFNREVELENSSFQRQVADMQKAGVNPALMYAVVVSLATDILLLPPVLRLLLLLLLPMLMLSFNYRWLVRSCAQG